MHSFVEGFQDTVTQFVKDNATTILTAGGVVGTVATAVLAGRGGLKAGQILMEKKGEIYSEQFKREPQDNPVLFDDVVISKKDQIILVGLQFAPAVLTGVVTITAIIFSHKMSANKVAALAAAYGISQKQFEEYRNKVQEQLTGPKAGKIDTELSQDRVSRAPGSNQIIVVEGEVLCFDEPSGRYFHCSMEQIRRAVNAVNELVLMEDTASASMFYDLIGLPETTWSKEVGFNLDNLCDLTYNYVEGEGGKPCLSINFKNMPISEFHRKY